MSRGLGLPRCRGRAAAALAELHVCASSLRGQRLLAHLGARLWLARPYVGHCSVEAAEERDTMPSVKKNWLDRAFDRGVEELGPITMQGVLILLLSLALCGVLALRDWLWH